VGVPHAPPTGRVAVWMNIAPLASSTTQLAVTLPAASAATEF
jgi:hypothetical protein